MSYNSELQSNNIDLQAILDTINTLPEAGSGGVELPELTNPGTASDLAQGKQLIGADGNVITGSIREVFEGGRIQLEVNRSVYDEENNCFQFSDEFSSDFLCRAESGVIMNCDCDLFGNATPDQVAKGATFTSASGLTIEGTHECEEGVELPPLSDDVRATSADMAKGKRLYDENGNVVEGNVGVVKDSNPWVVSTSPQVSETKNNGEPVLKLSTKNPIDSRIIVNSNIAFFTPMSNFGNATIDDVRQGKTFTSADGLLVEGTALIPGGGFVYPDGAFMPVSNFTDGKQYALVAVIDGVRRYINTTTYNDYTMNATQITIGEDAGNYVIFSATPALFTAVASGDGFLLQNGSNYLHGTSSGGTALRVGTTQMVWTVDSSATGGFSDGKYYAKEDSNSVWLMNNSSGYNWSIKYETAGSFGYDREGRDNTYSTGFVSLVLYEYVAGEGELNPVVDSSDANVTADKMLAGYSGYANGRKVEGNIQSRQAATITPSTTAQEIPAGVYLEGKQTISAIQTETKSVTQNGTYTPSSGKYFSSFTVEVPASGVDTSDATATASDIVEGATAYAKGVKITGSLAKTGTMLMNDGAAGDLAYDSIYDTVSITKTLVSKVLLGNGSQVVDHIKVNRFGDATAADVAAGKTFTSADGFLVEGTATIGGGSVIKSGTTTSATIATGLSEIEEFFIYKETQTATGLIRLHYSKTGGTSYMYASAWSTNNYGTKTITNATTAPTINGGSITLPSSTATSGGLSSGVTYKWTAIGKE